MRTNACCYFISIFRPGAAVRFPRARNRQLKARRQRHWPARGETKLPPPSSHLAATGSRSFFTKSSDRRQLTVSPGIAGPTALPLVTGPAGSGPSCSAPLARRAPTSPLRPPLVVVVVVVLVILLVHVAQVTLVLLLASAVDRAAAGALHCSLLALGLLVLLRLGALLLLAADATLLLLLELLRLRLRLLFRLLRLALLLLALVLLVRLRAGAILTFRGACSNCLDGLLLGLVVVEWATAFVVLVLLLLVCLLLLIFGH